jgi:hypothetical protein
MDIRCGPYCDGCYLSHVRQLNLDFQHLQLYFAIAAYFRAIALFNYSLTQY